LKNDENLESLDWVTHSAGSAPEVVVMMEVSPANEGEDGEGVLMMPGGTRPWWW
jgi:hypothetical protein